jgi:hypothetical protein
MGAMFSGASTITTGLEGQLTIPSTLLLRADEVIE